MAVKVGDAAPDFELENQRREPVRLSRFRGRHHVILAFHPLAWTPVCAGQMAAFQAALDRIETLGVRVLGVSTDSTATKAAWAGSLGLTFDLLSDFYPHGRVAEQYGVFRADGIADRAVFLVDRQGRIAYARVYDIPVQPDLEEVIRVLETLEP